MSTDNKWKPDFKKWYEVNKDAYKIVFEQAEKKMEDVLSESESITNKSIKMVAAVAAMFAFFVGFLVQKNIPVGYNAVFIIVFIVNVTGILFLIFPKEVRGRGVSPKKLLPKNLDAEDDKNFQEQMIYYSGIVILQDNIDFMIDKNTSRAKWYLAWLIFALVLLVSGATYIVASL
jgi:hypothetical protein